MKIYTQTNNTKNFESEEDFLKYHYTGYIDSNAYKDYEKTGGLSWVGDTSKYPALLETKQFNNLTIEFRQTGNKLQYVKTNDDGIVRDQKGLATYISDQEIQERGLNTHDTSIAAFHNNVPIALASNEWGADGIWVEKEYQQQGIGTYLLHIFRQQFNPDRQIGQMTPAGYEMAKSYYRNYVNPQS